mmetsp:Transcript_7213/g.11501  ORF Transcript_7213/g.11501 Transcript_7213/m.11501 type:complete len:310 (-) Transcript_7213:2693-3622(-)
MGHVKLLLVLGSRRYNVVVDSLACSMGQVKILVQSTCEPLLVPDAQRLLIKGKLRSDDTTIGDVLTDGEKGKLARGEEMLIKGKILLEKGFADVLKGEVKEDKAMPEGGATGLNEIASRREEKEGLVPLSSLKAGQILVNLQQGGKRYQVVAPSVEWTINDVKLYVQSRIGVPVHEQRILVKGKVRGDKETLEECKVSPPQAKMMLLFSDGYHMATDGEAFLTIANDELARATSVYEKFTNKIRHRMAEAADYIIEIDILVDRLENILNGLDAPVRTSSREKKLRVLREIPEMIEKLRNIKRYNVHGER